MAHPSARLSVFSRQLLVKLVVIDGWPVATVAEQLGISRATGYKWVRRYRADGLPGLEDRMHQRKRGSSFEAFLYLGCTESAHYRGSACPHERPASCSP